MLNKIISAEGTITLTTVLSASSPVSYTHLRAHETEAELVCRLLLEKKINKYDDSEVIDTDSVPLDD